VPKRGAPDHGSVSGCVAVAAGLEPVQQLVEVEEVDRATDAAELAAVIDDREMVHLSPQHGGERLADGPVRPADRRIGPRHVDDAC
jgi:hypothetical protein